LSAASLAQLNAQVARPMYDRTAIQVGIVHFGVGGFHRSHQAVYLDDLMGRGCAPEWGICGVGLLPDDARVRDALVPQDGLYTLLQRGTSGQLEARVVGSLVRYLFAPDDPQEVLCVLTAPKTRIISLTITEGGYNMDPPNGRFRADSASMLAEAATLDMPSTVFGYIVEALRRRRDGGLPGFTVLSCDNIEDNGSVARESVMGFARIVDPKLAEWIEHHVTFPSSMVDRITPVTTPEDIAELREQFGVEDAWPVVCEPFTQWILEDDFVAGRPPLENVGVQITPDVRAYEQIKLRLLNGGHQALAYSGRLAGYTYAHDAARDPVLETFLRGYMNEARRTLTSVPGIDLDDYVATLLTRFADPHIRDTLARLCASSSDRIPKWVVPIIHENLDNRDEIVHLVAVIASWARYCEGRDDRGRAIEIDDRLRDELVARAAQQSEDPLSFIRSTELFGSLSDSARFVSAYVRILEAFRAQGALRALAQLSRDWPQATTPTNPTSGRDARPPSSSRCLSPGDS
jgi:mannitol 2-dehydrogenase